MATIMTGLLLPQSEPLFGYYLNFSTLDVDSDGTELDVSWPDVSGATGVEVESASLLLAPVYGDSPGRALSTVAGEYEGTDLRITIPGGALAIRSFYLSGFKVLNTNWVTVRNQGDLPGGWRVAISLPEGSGFSAPAYAVPGVSLNPGIIPTLLAGASLDERVLRLPDVEAARFRLQVLSGDFPDGLTPQTFRVSSVSARAAPEPVDLAVVGPDGETQWEQAGRLTASTTVDLKASLKRSLEASIGSGSGPRATFRIQAEKPGQVSTLGLATQGRVLRTVAEKPTVTCEGDSKPLPIAGPPIDSRQPSSVVADVVIRHHGLRLHPISDPIPDRPGNLAGPVLKPSQPVLRILPPEAMMSEELRRVGLVAVVRESVEVAVRVQEVVGGSPTRALGDTATASVEPLPGFAAAQPRVLWVDLPKPLPVDRAMGIEASVSRGRLHWVAGDDGVPAVRFAVTLADPTGTTVEIGGQPISLTGLKTELLKAALPTAGFVGAPPVVATDQFCEVVVSNLTMEYRA